MKVLCALIPWELRLPHQLCSGESCRHSPDVKPCHEADPNHKHFAGLLGTVWLSVLRTLGSSRRAASTVGVYS